MTEAIRRLLYRSRESAVTLDAINEKARQPLKSVDEVYLVEVEGNEVARDYKVPVRIVRSLEALMVAPVNRHLYTAEFK